MVNVGLTFGMAQTISKGLNCSQKMDDLLLKGTLVCADRYDLFEQIPAICGCLEACLLLKRLLFAKITCYLRGRINNQFPLAHCKQPKSAGKRFVLLRLPSSEGRKARQTTGGPARDPRRAARSTGCVAVDPGKSLPAELH